MKLPPLKALPVFEAVARLSSFSAAAKELNVSQSAVSHQIKLLEDYLGERLFERGGRYLSLSESGQSYYEDVGAALRQLERATLQLQGTESTQLRLALFSSFAVRWLIPRLNSLHQQYPDVALVLEMTSDAPTLSERIADCFITIHRDHPGYHYELLYSEQLFPVCSRSFLQRMLDEQSLPEDAELSAAVLSRYTLLSTYSIFDETGGDWKRWFAAAKDTPEQSPSIQHFSHMLMALEAAKHHQGIALTNDYMVVDQEEDEGLVRLNAMAFDTGDRFYFACKRSRRHEPAIRKVRQWLLDQLKRSGLAP